MRRSPTCLTIPLWLLACVVVFGPERVPLDEAGTHWEFRVKLCNGVMYDTASTHLYFESRTYVRTLVKGVYQESPDLGQGTTWRISRDIPLYIGTGIAPEQEVAP